MKSLRSRNSSKKDSEKTPHRDCDFVTFLHSPRRSARLATDSNVTSPLVESNSPATDPKPHIKRKRGRPRKNAEPYSPTSTAKSSPKILRSRKRRKTNSDMDELTAMSQRINEGPRLRKSLRIRSMRSYENQGSANGSDQTQHRTPFDSDWGKTFLLDLQEKIRHKVDSFGLFSKPIERDEDGYYDDEEVMCFDLMEEMIQSGELESLDQYRECLGKIVKYVRKYKHNEENFVRKQAELIEERGQKIINDAMQQWEDRFVNAVENIKRSTRRCRSRQSYRRKSSSDLLAADASVDENDKNDFSNKTLVRHMDKVKGESLRIEKQNGRLNGHTSRLKRPRRRKKSTVKCIDDDTKSFATSSSSSYKDDDIEHNSSFEGFEIPFCNPMLSGSHIEACNVRSEWLRLCPKLLIVCNEAARRSTLRSDPSAERYEKPLSLNYINERIEYDDPLEGFIVRTDSEPYHIQGFILTTRFTTWRKTFRWTIDEPAALITPVDHRMHIVDKCGELTKELQSCERDDSNPSQGYSYRRICEISLLGGLGCGSALLSRALSELRQSDKYDYVVLQSTKIAIPFYEKHGFVRVGAVTRFNDIDTLPEVAYRHWSEIVNGVAVEPSYMMGRRLKRCSAYDRIQQHRPITGISKEARKEEIYSALISAYSLLSDALNVRIGSVAYINSFREILSAARDFAISADDYHLVQLIDKAQSEFTGSHFGKSKRLLRSELRCVYPLVQGDWIGDAVEELSSDNSQCEETECDFQRLETKNCKSIDIVAIINLEELSSYDTLDVSLPSDFLSPDDFFNVKVILNGEEFSENFLVAKLSRSIKATTQMLEAKELAVENMLSFMRKRSDSKRFEQSQVGIGDIIMLKIDGYDGLPLWVEATVKKQTKIRGIRPYYSGHNGYLVTWNDSEGPKHDVRVLDIRNRGVGKAWCTEIDWASFAVLPINILDCLLLGSKVCYPALNGKIVQGKVTQRIGNGIQNEPRFSVEMKQGKMRTQYYHLSAGEIREAVSIPDYNVMKTKKMLSHLALQQRKSSRAEGELTSRRDFKKSSVPKIFDEVTGEFWAKNRIQKYSLLSICDKYKDNLKNISKNDEEFIVHLSTGVNHNHENNAK
mmetsp:Transcript_695/g.1221  ORF Transcript_695/g.1221 Transcript_695/m.1221 type:complete len:1108 (+) Transcript_695:465-3788(+)|eukprot:CAMPEP_0176486322 /NCGR_PEP_ID=MMETSP0200_2-20121128/5507_1 /TAXON_ID=947934 /ORGANISM="Chaetoceros sp., Strain GSL56" /LENGTH=1107 /DNA_ID=CAMNT_0017883017 /DNA_START=443 /DNA_END=3766 /DNA_ORIENTATION=+